jgi:hypothetical protein
MPIISSLTRPTDAVYDAWGNVIRADWHEVPGKTYEPGQAHLWDISGETHRPGEGTVAAGDPSLMAGYTGGQALLQQALADPSFLSGARSYAAGPPGVQSVNAYNASLAGMGIAPTELPYGTMGQKGTARVFAQHGIMPEPGNNYTNSPTPGYRRVDVDQTNYQDLYKQILKTLGIG